MIRLSSLVDGPKRVLSDPEAKMRELEAHDVITAYTDVKEDFKTTWRSHQESKLAGKITPSDKVPDPVSLDLEVTEQKRRSVPTWEQVLRLF